MTRNDGVDFLKFIASFMIVCIHIPFPGVLGTVFTPLTRIAVPIFFMITGFYHSHIKERGNQMQQITKILKLCICVNLLYLFYSLCLFLIQGKTVNAFLSHSLNLQTVLRFVIFNESPFKAHLWYLGAILYVLVIVYVWEKRYNVEKLYPIVPLLLLADLILGKYSLVVIGHSPPHIYSRNFLFVGLPYFLIGDMLSRVKLKLRNKKLVCLSIVFCCTTLLEHFLLEAVGRNAVRDHYISTTFLSVSIFLLAVQYTHAKDTALHRGLSFVGARLSLGIYILHPIFVDMAKSISLPTTLDTVFGYIAPFLVFGGAIAASWVSYSFKQKLSKQP